MTALRFSWDRLPDESFPGAPKRAAATHGYLGWYVANAKGMIVQRWRPGLLEPVDAPFPVDALRALDEELARVSPPVAELHLRLPVRGTPAEMLERLRRACGLQPRGGPATRWYQAPGLVVFDGPTQDLVCLVQVPRALPELLSAGFRSCHVALDRLEEAADPEGTSERYEEVPGLRSVLRFGVGGALSVLARDASSGSSLYGAALPSLRVARPHLGWERVPAGACGAALRRVLLRGVPRTVATSGALGALRARDAKLAESVAAIDERVGDAWGLDGSPAHGVVANWIAYRDGDPSAEVPVVWLRERAGRALALIAREDPLGDWGASVYLDADGACHAWADGTWRAAGAPEALLLRTALRRALGSPIFQREVAPKRFASLLQEAHAERCAEADGTGLEVWAGSGALFGRSTSPGGKKAHVVLGTPAALGALGVR